MNSLEIGRFGMFRINQAAGYRLPGYLVVDTVPEIARFSDIPPEEHANLVAALALAEDLIIRLLDAERVYVLRMGESVPSLHFHVVPRTKEIATACGQLITPLNGAGVVDWVWRNHESLGYSDADVVDFAYRARGIVLSSR